MTAYDKDVIAWANEQATLLRAGQLDQLDIEHIADEIEDVARAEIRDFSRRMAVLLSHLIEWRFSSPKDVTQPSIAMVRIHRYRNNVARRLGRIPSLMDVMNDPDFWADAWGDAIIEIASRDNNNQVTYRDLPDICPWSLKQILMHDFLPNSFNTPSA